MRDLYSVLGVKRDAGADEIKAAWRSKAKSVHPDQNRDDPNATKRFAEIGRAYEVLKDPTKRNRYDEQRSKVEAMERGQTIMQQRQAAREAAERAKEAKANAERVLAELAKAEAEKAKADKAAADKIAAEEAKKAKAAAPKPEAPKTANSQETPNAGAQGSQGAQDTPPIDAAEDMVSRIFGESAEAQAASEALRRDAEAAAAKAAETNTGDAEGAPTDEAGSQRAPIAVELFNYLLKRIRKPQPVPEKAPDLTVEALVAIDDLLQRNPVVVTLSDGKDVRVPLEDGTTDGTVVRLKGQGLKLPNMQRGDVVATIRVLKTERFAVDGHDIRTILPVALGDAVLGCEMTVQTPTGEKPISIPAWSNSDHVITLENEGLANGEGGRGALRVELRVMLWEKPDDKVTDLMRVMREGLYL